MKRAQTKVQFKGHLDPEGLKADPAKVVAILAMPLPTNVKGLERFLGMVNNLAKFLPLLSDVTVVKRRQGSGVVLVTAASEGIYHSKTVPGRSPHPEVLRYQRCHNQMRCQQDWSGCCTNAEWTAHRLCLQGAY